MVAFFAMPERGHFQLLAPLISELTRRGLPASVWTDRRFEAGAAAAGAEFVDLFERYPLEAADSESIPLPCRYVSFAGCFAEEIARDLAELRPSLIVYETFAVIGWVVARLLGVPYVNVCPGHNMDPARFVPDLREDPRVAISADCERAVRVLRERFGVDDATPFSYVSGLSPHLNVYCEPDAFLTESERRAFEPIAFFGSLPAHHEVEPRRRDGETLTVYASFGTVVWRYWAAEALDVLGAISNAIAGMPGVRAVLVAPPVTDTAALRKHNVDVSREVDQWEVLQEADLFVTHHGINSTHEAIVNGVPMLSCPFFSDQPGLAEKCQGFGLAIPLMDRPRGPVSEDDVRAALTQFTERREAMAASLAQAREWELETIAGRDAVVRRITDLIET